MTFLAPGRLWLLLGLAALAAVYLVQQRRRSRYTVRFTDLSLLASVAPRRPGWRRHVPAGLLALSLAALVVGFARPQAEVDVPRERATVLVALDTSLSMEAVDVTPDRLTAAQRAATRFVEELPDRFNVGLVSFSGNAAVVVPPTQDHDEVAQQLQDLTLDSGTAIGEAVFTSLSALRLVPGEDGAPPPPARIVLLSDGTNTVGRSVESAVEAATAAGVPVSTIAFGTQDGTVEVDGTSIAVPVDRAALRGLAEGDRRQRLHRRERRRPLRRLRRHRQLGRHREGAARGHRPVHRSGAAAGSRRGRDGPALGRPRPVDLPCTGWGRRTARSAAWSRTGRREAPARCTPRTQAGRAPSPPRAPRRPRGGSTGPDPARTVASEVPPPFGEASEVAPRRHA